jgi:Flp pilus assembly pilin Flp
MKTDTGIEWGILLALIAFVVVLATGIYIESI